MVIKDATLCPGEKQQVQDALQSLMSMFRIPSDGAPTLYLYAILKECKFNAKAAYSKIIEAQTDMRTYALRESPIVPTTLPSYWPSLIQQGTSGSSLIYPPIGCLPSYYHYPMGMSSNGLSPNCHPVTTSAYGYSNFIPGERGDHILIADRDDTDSEGSNVGLPPLLHTNVHPLRCHTTFSPNLVGGCKNRGDRSPET